MSSSSTVLLSYHSSNVGYGRRPVKVSAATISGMLPSLRIAAALLLVATPAAAQWTSLGDMPQPAQRPARQARHEARRLQLHDVEQRYVRLRRQHESDLHLGALLSRHAQGRGLRRLSRQHLSK